MLPARPLLAVAFCLLAAIWPASAQAADTDGDGLEDSVETNTGVYVSPSATGTDPGNPDTDGDEMPDGWEVANGLDPNADDAADNPDGDGLTNLQEFIFGTDPQTYDPVETMIAFTVVGDPGNPDDDQTTPEGAKRVKDNENGGVGYVGQTFGIGETEITNKMYARFLNAVAKRDRLYSLYSTLMNDDEVNGGIGRSGTDGSYVYTVYAGWEDKPVNYISGFDAKRFCNWLHNGMPGDPEAEDPAKRTPLTGDQNASSTEDGAYTLLGANEDQIIRRNLGARYHLPDQDEFHKAAYYDPDGGIDHNNPGGRPRSSESYWWFADQSMIGPGGNYDTYDAGAVLGERLLLADVATFRASPTSTGKSYYGTFDQDGNVNEWLDAAITATAGNQQYYAATTATSLTYTAQDALTQNYKLGFRVARRMPDAPSEQVVVPLAVEIGEPENHDDEEFGPELADEQIGAVNYPFQMGAYEVTNRDYVRFLNTKAKDDHLYHLYDTRMGSDEVNGGIARSGVDGNYSYEVKAGFGRKPVVYVSIFSAMRYCNWLHNGGGPGSDMEAGAYRLLGNIPPNTDQLTRNAGARYYLPNTSEFYKSAYYDNSREEPEKALAAATFNYWKFATRSDEYDPFLNAAVLADVDFTDQASYFGTYGQSGNVGYSSPGSGANTAAPKPTAANTGELLEEASNTDDESATRTFRIAAAEGMPTLHPLADEDGDGMPNGWEVLNSLDDGVNPPVLDPNNPDDAGEDPDGDLLTNLQEYQNGTNPNNIDTDGDGLSDGDEVNLHGTNPSNPDTDGDGLSDGVEVTGGTNPLVFTQGTVPLMVEIGEPGNLDDEEFGREFYDEAIGKVAYAFQMGAYEVTNRDYVRFLNFKAREDGYFRLFDARMETDTTHGGIIRTGENGSYSYVVKSGFAKKPVVYVSVFSAMRYCNWMHNGGRPDSGMETGAYALMGSNPANSGPEPPRSASARFFIPKSGEFYKAAYYDSSAAANTTFDYWKFATRSDESNPAFNSSTLEDVDSTSDSDGDNLYDTGAASFFGTYGQSGNIGYVAPDSGMNTPAKKPATSNSGELIDDRRPNQNDDEINSGLPPLWTFRISAATGVETLRPLADEDGDGMPNGWEVLNSLDDGVNSPVLDPNNPDDAGEDPDGDHLTNLQEYQAGSDPNNIDTDGDGMPDKWEVDYGLDPTDPADAANDGEPDGLTNLEEYEKGTDPNNADSDGDGMPDGWEVEYDLDPNDPADAGLDGEPDGLTNLQEYQNGTNPNNIDTDGDGMSDKWEVDYGLDPTSNDANQDKDTDGLTNLKELDLGTRPDLADTDNDGMDDYWENYYGRDPVSGTDRDTDNDGASDADEIAAGTDPMTFNTPAAAPAMVTVGAAGNVANGTNGGAVAYEYRIGTYEVTCTEYAAFLNAVAKTDPHKLYDPRMAYSGVDDSEDPWPETTKVTGGITRAGSAGAYVYEVKPGYESKPANFVSYGSAQRYCNWLHNGGTNDADTENGAYGMTNTNSTNASVARINEWARFWMPNQDEWYKAAAYDVSAGPLYWQYAVRSNSTTISNVAVWALGGLVDVDSVKVPGSGGSILPGTDLPAPPSYFGTYGQSGNAAEWVESADSSQPNAYGGSIISTQYSNAGDGVKTTTKFQPTYGAVLSNSPSGRYDIGFRIASLQPVTLPVPPAFSARYPGIKPTDRMDGLPALLDYLFGGSASAPPAKTNLPTQTLADGKIRYSFVVRTDDPSLAYEVQTATDLNGPWTTDNVTALTPEPVAGNLSRRTFEIPVNGDRQRFFRLVVEQN